MQQGSVEQRGCTQIVADQDVARFELITQQEHGSTLLEIGCAVDEGASAQLPVWTQTPGAREYEPGRQATVVLSRILASVRSERKPGTGVLLLTPPTCIHAPLEQPWMSFFGLEVQRQAESHVVSWAVITAVTMGEVAEIAVEMAIVDERTEIDIVEVWVIQVISERGTGRKTVVTGYVVPVVGMDVPLTGDRPARGQRTPPLKPDAAALDLPPGFTRVGARTVSM